MKSTRYIFLVLFMSLANIGLMAQRKNQITIPDIAANFGEAELVVNIDNTDEIVALQFDLSLPEGVMVETNSARMTNRSNGHAVSVKSMYNEEGETFYRVFMFSSSNKALAGQSGEAIRIPITLPDTFEEGGSYPMTISNAVLSTTTGENVLTKATAGFIGIQNLPDLTVSNITVDHDSFMPGDDIVVSWQVENVGHLATGDGWSEDLSLVSEDGESRYYLTTVYYDEPLGLNAKTSRQTEITVPRYLGLDGNTRLEVQVVPNSQTGESTASLGNNTAQSEQLLNVGKKLYIELYPTTITENENESVTLILNRSGSCSETETFNLTATSDSRISVPETVEIEEGQTSAYIYLDVANNDVFDENTQLDFSAEGNGYEAVTAQLNIEDDDLPKLSITASDTDINEGDTFQLTISTSRVFAAPITVELSCEESSRFTFPHEVVIPEGETSVTIDVVAVDNDEIERQESIAFRASADRHETGECVVILNDNDMPTLTFTLSPESVSESAGATALFGIIKRTDNFDKRVVLKLSDDSNGLLTYSNDMVVMEKKQTEVQFNIGVADNDKVDGDRVVNVIASVYESSCDCSVTDDAKGTMTATVTIIDDDGPMLTIKPEGTAMLEGSACNVFVISHNAQSNSDVTVRISSDKDDLLEYEHELTIPAGQTSANLLVNVKSNDQQDDSSVATFKVEANEYSMGTCWILITDQTLPDAIVSLTADKTEAEAEGAVLLRVEVKNVGNSTLPSNTPVEISFSGRKKTVNLTVGQSVPAGESAIIEYNYDLPAITGTYTFEATVNATEKVAELIYANNTSEPVSITLISPFSVTAKADKDIYQQTDNIVVSGKATGKGVNNAAVEVYFINEESRQTVTATTDTDGNYSVSWKPLDKQSGHFIVGACYPGSNVSEEMDAFDVYGIRARDNYATCELSLGETKNGSIFITNPGNLTQKGLQVTLKAQSENCVFTFNAPKTIGADKEIEIAYTVTANGVSEGTDWQKMPIEITTAEGSHLDYVIYYYVNFQKAKLSSNTTHISTTMTLSKPREYPVVIRNVGKGETGKITLALPAWIQTLTPREMASLAQGDSTTIMLRFVPTEEMKLNVRVEGQIGINCENGDGIAIVFDLTPVSDDKGTLKVDVKDEFTYYTDEAPHVSNALVQVKNPSTNEVVAEGKTAEDGTFSAELPEGYYSIKVEADKHDSYENTVIVDPSVNKEQEIWLSYQAVTYSWDVVETEIEDEYEIETIAKYETRVPKPIVVINLPDERPEPNSIIPITVTNKGLVHALDFSMNLSVNSDYTVEFLNDPRMETLEAQQSYVFYAKLKLAETTSGAKASFAPRKAGSKRKCLDIGAVARHKQDCEKYPDYEYSYAKKQYGDCSTGSGGSDTDGGSGNWSTGGGNGPGYSPGGSGSSSYEALYNFIYTNGTPAKYCDETDNNDGNEVPDDELPEVDPNKDPFWTPCKNDILGGASNCVLGIGLAMVKSTPFTCGIGVAASIGQLIKDGFSYFGFLGLITSALGCVPGAGPAVNATLAALNCASSFLDPYLSCTGTNLFGDDVRHDIAKKTKGKIVEDPIDDYLHKLAVAKEELSAYYGMIVEFFGDEEWLESDPNEVVKLVNYLQCLNSGEIIEVDDDLLRYQPSNISEDAFLRFIERHNNAISNNQSQINCLHVESLSQYANTIELCENYAENNGYTGTQEMIEDSFNSFVAYLDSIKKDDDAENSPSVCTTVTLSFKQKNVMTRQAFRGTLTINNGNETAALENVKLNLEVRDKDGQLATSHEFQIDGESLDGFEGELGLNSGWTLGAGKAGTATILFIPTKYAAQTEPEEYSFGGSFSYTDPSTGLTVTRALNPVTLTVNPSPNLEMTYFMQRDVFGDDPFTEEVEPMVPSEFALLVNNKGYGDAVNMSLTTQQPQIIENKKGLAIDFELISSQLNGGEKNLSLGGSMTSDFGTVPAHSQAYAQWWLQSSLLGHYIEYNVKATHLTSRENPDLSLVDTVTIHELIHGYTVSRDDGQTMRGFLVNDIKDAEDLPDRVYFTDATQKEVTVNNNATIVKQSETEYLLTVSGSSSGWNYGSLLDPTQGKQVLSSIVRQSDGATLPVDNIWQTDRTLRDGKDWLYENRLHFIGEMSSSGESYLLTFEPRPDEYLCVEGYDGLPAEGEVAAEPVKVVTVKFNKAVDEGTFTPDDISLSCQGKSLDTSKITITKVSDTEYEIDLSALTSEDGFYVLTVQTANISDAEGYAGESGKQAMWTQSGFLLGDVNHDRRINGMDIVELVELIMDSRFDRAGDLYPAGHPDGVLTGMDLVEEVELVMSQTSANPAPALVDRTERLAMKSERSGVKSLGIQSDRPFILAQMTVELSEGMTLSSITSDRRHEVAYRQTGDNKYVVVCYSNRNESFEANGKALEFHCLGEGGIRVSDVLLIDADKQECLGTDAQSGDVTGIQEMEDERLKMNDSDIYDLSGRKIESSTFKAQSSKLQKGVYIINNQKVTIK